jgi:hypothetical protein
MDSLSHHITGQCSSPQAACSSGDKRPTQSAYDSSVMLRPVVPIATEVALTGAKFCSTPIRDVVLFDACIYRSWRASGGSRTKHRFRCPLQT